MGSAASGVPQVLERVRSGRPVVVAEGGPTGEGCLVFAAEFATAELMAYMVRHTSGYVCVAVPEDEAERLSLPTQSPANRYGHAVSVDARQGLTTGISAADRALTARLLADAGTSPASLTRPGHVVPIRTRQGGVLESPEMAECASDLAALAGLRPVSVLAAIVSPTQPIHMAQGTELSEFADRAQIEITSIADIVQHRQRIEPLVFRRRSMTVRLAAGDCQAIEFASIGDEREWVAFVVGDVDSSVDLPVYLHTDDGPLRPADRGPDTGGWPRRAPDLVSDLHAVSALGRGVVVYQGPRDYGGLLCRLGELQACEGGRGAASSSAHDGRVIDQMLADLGVRSWRHHLQDELI